MDHLWLLAFIFVVYLESVCGEYCTAYNNWATGYRTFHCSFGCCGPSSDEYCCAGSAGAIVGIVLGAICGIAVVATIICCCVKQHNHRGHIIQQVPGTGTYVASHTTNANIFVVPTGGYTSTHTPHYPVQYNNVYGTPGRPAPSFPPPPGYNQPGFVLPPAYSQTAALHPPPTYSQAGASAPTYSSNDLPQKPPVPTGATT